VTEVGVPIGTAAYMSPEQVRGQAVDKRTDIWAFGCVLYEMLTATRAFDGDTVSDTLSNVLTRQPDLARVPASVRPLLRSCLEQDARRRLRDIGDYWRLLEEPALVRRQRNYLPWAIAAIATAAAVLAFWNWSRTPLPQEAPLEPSVSIALDLGPELSMATNFPMITLSPDGERIVFVAEKSTSVTYLATKRLDQGVVTALPGTEDAYAPFFAPDGQWIGFFAEGQLKKTRLDGGAPIVLTRAPAGRGASWGDDGEIVAALSDHVGLSRVSSTTGAVTPLTTLGAGETSHRFPQVLPGARVAVFTVRRTPSSAAAADIGAVLLDGPAPAVAKIVREGAGHTPHYLPTGHLVYVTDGVLQALPFEIDALETRGTPTVVLDELSASANFGSAQLSFSRTGAVLYRGGRTTGRTRLEWLTGDGQTAPLWDEPAFYQYPKVSPDGGRLVVTVSEGVDADLWVFDAERGTKTRLTNGGYNGFAVWHPDGRYIVFEGREGLYSVRADGAERPQLVLNGEDYVTPSSFTPDGKRLLFFESRPTGIALKTVAIEENAGRLHAGTPELFREIPGLAPTFSPDGRWIAFASSESGVYEIYVRAFPDDGSQVPVSSGGGNFPVWSRTANELFYRTEDQLLMAASYTVVNGAFVAARPRVWSQRRLFNSGLAQNFDIAPDGRRFAVQVSAEEPDSQEAHPVMLQVNFFDEVRRRVAGDSE
jgi:serine/threonine-protein kinase